MEETETAQEEISSGLCSKGRSAYRSDLTLISILSSSLMTGTSHERMTGATIRHGGGEFIPMILRN